jgi:hypothetical protein
MVVDRPLSSGPSTLSCFASILATLHRIGRSQASVAFSCCALICLSWICHSNWQEQIAHFATDVVEPDGMKPDAVEPDAGLEV